LLVPNLAPGDASEHRFVDRLDPAMTRLLPMPIIGIVKPQ
jgi:hypothetical protein